MWYNTTILPKIQHPYPSLRSMLGIRPPPAQKTQGAWSLALLLQRLRAMPPALAEFLCTAAYEPPSDQFDTSDHSRKRPCTLHNALAPQISHSGHTLPRSFSCRFSFPYRRCSTLSSQKNVLAGGVGPGSLARTVGWKLAELTELNNLLGGS